MRSTLASSAGSVPGFARGARCAPRQPMHAQHGGGVARSLRLGGLRPARCRRWRLKCVLLNLSIRNPQLGSSSSLGNVALVSPSGFRIVRVSAQLVLSDLAAAVALVRAAL